MGFGGGYKFEAPMYKTKNSDFKKITSKSLDVPYRQKKITFIFEDRYSAFWEWVGIAVAVSILFLSATLMLYIIKLSV